MKITRIDIRSWLIDFTYNNKRFRRVIHGSRQAADQAIRILKEKEDKARFGIPEPKKRIRIEDYINIYKDQYEYPRSLRNLEIHTRTLLAHFKGKFLDEITPGDIEKYKNKRKKEVSNGSTNRELSTLKAMYNKAINSEDYGLVRNPVKKVDFLKEKSEKERILTHTEQERLLELAKSSESDTLYVFLVIALNTGMRKMEILSLKWENASFSKGRITVPKERAKSGRSREIPMNDNVIEELTRRDKTNEYVFYNPKTRTYIRNIKTAFWRICRIAKVKGLRLHDLRHTAASRLVNDCAIDIVTASKILGHSDIQMTVKYIHPTDDHKRLAIERLGEIFKGEPRHNPVISENVVQVKRSPLPHIIGH